MNDTAVSRSCCGAFATILSVLCLALALVSGETASAQADDGAVPFDAKPPAGRRCTCKDIEDLVDNMYGGAASATHYRGLEQYLNGLEEHQSLSREASQQEWLADEGSFRIPARDRGAGGGVGSATPAAAETDGDTCRSVIPRSNLARYCGWIIQAMWEHERVHRENCMARRKSGHRSAFYPGSYHAREEADAYEAGNAIVRKAIEQVLEESSLRVQATVTPSRVPDLISYDDATIDLMLKPQGASGDGVVEFLDSTGKGQTRFTKLRHGECSAAPVNQALAVSFRSVDMQNFTVSYRSGKPRTHPYDCPITGSFAAPLPPLFAGRWEQPIRRRRPFPSTAWILLPGFDPMSPDAGMPRDALPQLPDLTTAETPFGIVDTMVTLSCP